MTCRLPRVGGRFPEIVNRNPDAPDRNRQILRLCTVAFPCLDRCGRRLGKITFAEAGEMRRITTQHMEHGAAFIGDLLEDRKGQAVDGNILQYAHFQRAQDRRRSAPRRS